MKVREKEGDFVTSDNCPTFHWSIRKCFPNLRTAGPDRDHCRYKVQTRSLGRFLLQGWKEVPHGVTVYKQCTSPEVFVFVSVVLTASVKYGYLRSKGEQWCASAVGFISRSDLPYISCAGNESGFSCQHWISTKVTFSKENEALATTSAASCCKRDFAWRNESWCRRWLRVSYFYDK